MQPADWVELLKKIPAEHYERMVVATHQEMEIAINRVLYIGPDYFLFRGRLGGTTDTFRLFCLPYDRVVYIGFARPVPEAELESIFGPVLKPPTVPKAEEPPPEEADEESPASEPPPEAKPSDSKITLLEKLRARAAAQSSDPSKRQGRS